MFANAKEHSAENIGNWRIADFWINESCDYAEGALAFEVVSGPSAGLPYGDYVVMVKQGGEWVCTDYGTGAEVKHLR